MIEATKIKITPWSQREETDFYCATAAASEHPVDKDKIVGLKIEYYDLSETTNLSVARVKVLRGCTNFSNGVCLPAGLSCPVASVVGVSGFRSDLVDLYSKELK